MTQSTDSVINTRSSQSTYAVAEHALANECTLVRELPPKTPPVTLGHHSYRQLAGSP